MKPTGPTNVHLRLTIAYLRKASRKYGNRIWRRVAELLSVPRRRRIAVNVSKINRYTKDGDIVVVPGKVLGCGSLDHRVIIGAWSFSKSAKEKIIKTGGEALSLIDLVERYPKGSNVKIIT